MDNRKYTAFISYRHKAVDTAVAKQIHFGLEHYKIPKDLKKSHQQKSIGRIFRDEDELPLSSNLSDSIQYALKNSEYLIVILSPDTQESVWVSREIDFFLQFHNNDKDKIILVHAAGDPTEIIPEKLRYKDYYDEKEKTWIKKEVEPLLANYTNHAFINKKTELPRIVACILGVPYDELYQRDKKYRQKRLFTVMSVTMAFLCCALLYVSYTNYQINQNMIALKQQRGRIIVNAADETYHQNQGLTKSIAFSMLAYPNSEKQKLSIPELDYFLTDKMRLYDDSHTADLLKTITVDDDIARKMCADKSGDNLFIPSYEHSDQTDLSVEEPTSLLKLHAYSFQLNQYAWSINLPSENNEFQKLYYADPYLITETDSHIYALNPADGNIIWEYQLNDCGYSTAYDENSKQIILISQEDAHDIFTFLSIWDGTEKRVESTYKYTKPTYAFHNICIENNLLIYTTQLLQNGYEYAEMIIIYDIQNNIVKDTILLDESHFTDQYYHLLLGFETYDTYAYFVYAKSYKSDNEKDKNQKIVICYDLVNQKIAWKKNINNSKAALSSIIKMTPMGIMCTIHDTIYCFNPENGKTINLNAFNSQQNDSDIIDISVSNNNTIAIYFQDGSVTEANNNFISGHNPKLSQYFDENLFIRSIVILPDESVCFFDNNNLCVYQIGYLSAIPSEKVSKKEQEALLRFQETGNVIKYPDILMFHSKSGSSYQISGYELICYDKNNTITGKYDFSEIMTILNPEITTVLWNENTSKKEISVIINNNLYIFDTASLTPKCLVKNVVFYDNQKECIYKNAGSANDNQSNFVSQKRLSSQELRECAYEFIGEYQVSGDELLKIGIK